MGATSAASSRGRGQEYPLFLGPLVLAMGLIFLAIGVPFAFDEIRLSVAGTTADGVVVERSVIHGSESDSYRVAYRFTTRDGRTVDASDQVGYGTFARLSAGDPVSVTYVADEPTVSRLGGPGLTFLLSLGLLAFGVLCAPLGAGLIVTSLRRRGTEAVGGGAGSGPVAVGGVYRFMRPPVRIVVDFLGPLIGAVVFLGAAGAMLANARSEPLLAIMGLGFGFFGLLMASGVPAMLRRGIRGTLLEISPTGLWTPESGHLRWAEIRRIVLEDAALVATRTGRVRSRATGSGYRRLGIFPADPERAAHAPGGVARTLVRAFAAFAHPFAPAASRVTAIDQLAPFGIYEFELEVPLESIVPLVARHVPVVDATGRFVREADAERFADRVGAGDGTLTPERLAALDRALDPRAPTRAADATRPSTSTLVADDRSGSGGWRGPRGGPDLILPPARSVSYTRKPWLMARGVSELVGALTWIGFPVFFLIAWVAIGSGGMPIPVLLLPLTVVLPFVIAGIDPLLRSLVRFAIARGPETVLTVTPDAVTIQETLRIGWGAIAAVRLGGLGSGETPDRPRLEIVPHDASLVARRPWAERVWDRSRRALRAIKPFGDRSPIPPTIAIDLHDLDGDPDEILDLIDRFRRVEVDG